MWSLNTSGPHSPVGEAGSGTAYMLAWFDSSSLSMASWMLPSPRITWAPWAQMRLPASSMRRPKRPAIFGRRDSALMRWNW